MALSSSSTITTALAQLNDNLRWWSSRTKAENAYEAVLWLYANRARVSADAGTSISFEELSELRRKLEKHLGIGDVSSERTSFVRGRPL